MVLAVAIGSTAPAVTLPANQAVGASPYVYVNASGVRQQVLVSGGTVTAVEVSRDGTNYFPAGVLAGSITLNPGDRVRVTYAVAPTMTLINL